MKLLECMTLFLILSNPVHAGLIAEFVQTFDFYHLEHVTYEAISIPSHEQADLDLEMSKEMAYNWQFYLSGHHRDESYKTLILTKYAQLDKVAKYGNISHHEQFVKDPSATFFLYTFSQNLPGDISNGSFYNNLKLKFPLQPTMFLLSHQKENIFDVHEMQIYAKKSMKIAIWNVTSNIIDYFNQDLHQRRQNLTGVTLTTCHSSLESQFKFGNKNGEFEFDGPDGRVLSLFKKKFNFSIKWNKFSNYGTQHPNGTWMGIIRDLQDQILDFCKQICRLTFRL